MDFDLTEIGKVVDEAERVAKEKDSKEVVVPSTDLVSDLYGVNKYAEQKHGCDVPVEVDVIDGQIVVKYLLPEKKPISEQRPLPEKKPLPEERPRYTQNSIY